MAGNQGNNRIVWKPWQLKFLTANWKTMTAQQLSDALSIKRTKVREKKYELGFLSMTLEYWKPSQVKLLRASYKKIGDSELAEIFNRRWVKKKGWSKKHIEKKRRYLGLKRTEADKRAIHGRNVKKGCFALCPVKAWVKRGISKVGTVRQWNVNGRIGLFIKTASGYTPYPRWLYRKEVGRIPRGKMVRLIDGNPMNVTVKNMKLISRKENARLNSQNRTPKEYLQTRKLINIINRKIKKYEQQTL